jgi:hypothetical protein
VVDAMSGNSMLSGKGFFIWKIRYCEGGNPFAIAEQAIQLRLSHMLIKCADGPFRHNIFNSRDLIPGLVSTLRERGIQVWLWQYIYGINPGAEAMVAIERINQLQPDGYVVNAEVEYKKRPEQAEAYMRALRSGVGNDFPVALSTYRFPSLHRDFPFKQFMDYCDFAMPQVYWMKADNPRQQLERTLAEYQQFGKPVFPTGACFREHGWQPKAAEIIEFMQACKELSLQGCNFWEWANARQYVQDGWEAIRLFDWDTNIPLPPASESITPSPSPSPSLKMKVLVDGQNIRSGPGINHPVVGKLRAGDSVDVINVVGADVWVEIEPGKWAAVHYSGRRFMEKV